MIKTEIIFVRVFVRSVMILRPVNQTPVQFLPESMLTGQFNSIPHESFLQK